MFSGIIDSIQEYAPLPVLIGVVLAVAFITMLAVTIWTIISIKRAEIKSRKVIDLPPSATVQQDNEIIDNQNSKMPPPLGEMINRYIISKGFIRVHSIVHSFFKAMDFMKNALGSGYRYKLPWFMVVGTSGSGKSSLLSGFTHDEILDDESSENADCTWWFLKGGVILDINGEVFLPSDSLKSNEKSWNIILNMLKRFRTQKPLNGIVLAIPADEIYGKNKKKPEEIKQRALYISRKLNFAQNYLGMKLPVYVVITKSDIIPGFQSFCSEIPVRNRNNMLGWSCPYSIESMYSSRWIDEAFESIEDELNEIRMEIFSESGIAATIDGVFVFPSEALTVKESVRIYADALFRSGSVEERFYFRGVYFAGDSKMVPLLQFSGSGDESDMAIMGTPDADVNEAGSLTASFRAEEFAPKRIFFFEDLLLKKVFMEDGIATPMQSSVYQSNRAIFIAKVSTAAFVVIGSYGLFNARDNMKTSKDRLYPSLFKVSSIIKDASSLSMKNLQSSGNEILSDCVGQLLMMMQRLNSVRFSSLFVPASWFSSINKELTETLRISYQRVVVRTIYMNLVLNSRNLLTLKPGGKDVSTNIAEVLNPYKSKEYCLLNRYVEELLELERNIKKFDSLRSSGDPKDLSDLIDYTFHGSLPDEFLNNYDQFRRILMNTPFPSINLSPYRKVAHDVLVNLFQNFISTIFSDEKEGSIVCSLNRFIKTLPKQNDCAELRRFSEGLTSVCKELGTEGKTWLDNETFQTEEVFDSFLDKVEELFGKETAQRLLDITAVNFSILREKLEKFNNLLQDDSILPVKNSKKNKKKDLSYGIFWVERALSSVCQEPYMQEAGDHTLVTDIPEGKMIYWDDELIQHAYEIGRSFEQFFSSKLKDFPRPMQEGVLLMARSNLCAVIASTVARAQNLIDAPSALTDLLTSEEILQKQVLELKGVAPKFISLMNILRTDTVSFVFSDLRTILNRIGFSLLYHIDNLLEDQSPYMPKNLTFTYWDGEIGAGYQAYSANDHEEMALYILLQRKNISRLALEFAEPIVTMLNSDVIFDQNFGNHGQLAKWNRIVDGVKGMKARDPGNPVSVVERFAVKTLNTYNLDNITTEIPLSSIRGRTGDYFVNIIKEIKKAILARAEVLIRQRNIKRYNALRDFYNRRLLNKYPFTNYDKSQRVAVDADVEDVRQFFRMYDEFGGTPEKVLDQIYQLGDVAKEAYEFIKKVHDMRTFFGDFVKTQYEAPRVRIEIDFNVNKRAETNTDYLVDRVFKPNDDANLEFISEDKSAIWYFGEPVVMNLRWASGDDTADKPLFDSNDPDVIVDESTAKIECLGNWSVLRFLQKYKVEDVNVAGILPNQTIVCFKIPLNSRKTAKVYAAITASVPLKPDDTSVTTVKLPRSTEDMPEMGSGVVAQSHHAVLVETATAGSMISEQPDSLEEDSFDDSGDQVAEQSEKKAAQKTPKQQTKKKPKSDAEKAIEILESQNIEETPEIEISEEPIG